MQTSSGITFKHLRIENTKSASGDFEIGATTYLSTLPPLGIHELIIDKRAIKIYMPYGRNESIYYPTGMEGPVIKLVGSCTAATHYDAWEQVYANDILQVIDFSYPTYNDIIGASSTENPSADIDEWWVDIVEMDIQPGFVFDNNVRYIVNLDLYRKSKW